MLLKPGTHLSTHRSTPNCRSAPVWTAQTTWGIRSEHAHALCGLNPIIIHPSKLALFCSVRTAICHFCCLGSEQVYFMLLWIKFYSVQPRLSDQLQSASCAHIRSNIQTQAALNHYSVHCGADLYMLKYVPSFWGSFYI